MEAANLEFLHGISVEMRAMLTWHHSVVVFTTAQVSLTKSEIRFCAGSILLVKYWGRVMVRTCRNGQKQSSRCSVKKLFLKISQNSQESECAKVPLLIKLQAGGLASFIG